MEPWAPGEELEEAELREKELQDGNCGSLKVGGGGSDLCILVLYLTLLLNSLISLGVGYFEVPVAKSNKVICKH